MTQQTNGAFGPFSDTINFIIELDKLKRVYRKNNVLDNSRAENTAEHSWHFAVAAMSFQPYAGDIDIGRAIQLALVHDIVEIDAGDVMVYDVAAREAIKEQEQKQPDVFFRCYLHHKVNIFLISGLNMMQHKPLSHNLPIF